MKQGGSQKDDQHPATGEVMPECLRRELERNWKNNCVGRALISETTEYRIWSATLDVGERMSFHRHSLDYFRVWLTDACIQTVTHKEETRTQSSRAGDVRHIRFSKDEFLVRDLTNLSNHPISFLLVERLDGDNAPGPVPDHIRKSADPFGKLLQVLNSLKSEAVVVAHSD